MVSYRNASASKKYNIHIIRLLKKCNLYSIKRNKNPFNFIIRDKLG